MRGARRGAGHPAAWDNCDTSLTWAATGATTGNGNGFVGTMTFNTGKTLITYILSDPAGNADTCSFTVTVETEGGQIEAVLDIKPGSCPNSVNVERNWNKSKAVLPVAMHLGGFFYDPLDRSQAV